MLTGCLVGSHVLRRLRELFTFFSTVYCRFFPNHEHIIFIYFRIFIFFGCTGSLFLHMGFLQLQQAQAALCLWCMGSSLWWLLGTENGLWGEWASIVAALGLSSCGTRVCCSTACGVFLDQGSSLCSLHWWVDS